MSTNKPCPKCRESGHDSTGDHCWLMNDGTTWACLKEEYHSNSKPYYEREGDSGQMEETSVESFDELLKSVQGTEEEEEDPLANLIMEESAKVATKVTVRTPIKESYRAISPGTYADYGVFGVYSGSSLEKLGHDLFNLEGDVVVQKYREIKAKKFYTSGKTKGIPLQLFGQSTAKSAKVLVITEGELDAMSIHEAFKKVTYAKPCVVSVPTGANVKAITDNASFISTYPELVICGDNDTAGNKWMDEMASLYPTAKFMNLGASKDANEALEFKGDLVNAFYKAEGYKPPYLVDISKLKASLSDPIPMGYSTPWPTLDRLTFGISKGAIISVAAAPSAGKTVFVRGIQKHLMEKHHIKTGIYSLEESPETVLRNLVAYEMGVAIGVPGVTYDAAEAEKIATSLEKDCFIYDSSHYNGNWKAMIASMRQLCSLGMEVAIVDPVSSLVIGQSASEGNEMLGIIMGDMIKLTQETGLSVILVNHLNNAKGKAHENGGRVLASEMTGSRSQYRYSSLILGLERDLLNEDETIRDTLNVRILKSRLDGSKSGKVCSLKYDQTLKRLVELVPQF